MLPLSDEVDIHQNSCRLANIDFGVLKKADITALMYYTEDPLVPTLQKLLGEEECSKLLNLFGGLRLNLDEEAPRESSHYPEMVDLMGQETVDKIRSVFGKDIELPSASKVAERLKEIDIYIVLSASEGLRLGKKLADRYGIPYTRLLAIKSKIAGFGKENV